MDLPSLVWKRILYFSVNINSVWTLLNTFHFNDNIIDIVREMSRGFTVPLTDEDIYCTKRIHSILACGPLNDRIVTHGCFNYTRLSNVQEHVQESPILYIKLKYLNVASRSSTWKPIFDLIENQFGDSKDGTLHLLRVNCCLRKLIFLDKNHSDIGYYWS
jgi:hypothetical protein